MGRWPLAKGREKVVGMPSWIVDFAKSPPRLYTSVFLRPLWHSLRRLLSAVRLGWRGASAGAGGDDRASEYVHE